MLTYAHTNNYSSNFFVLHAVPGLSGTSESPAGSQATTESKHMHYCVI